jgi:amidase
LPLYHGEDGLPTGVQLIGPPAREDLLLGLATQLEQALPWSDRRPNL